mmetsp:Transcript_18595/g.44696  ORF Transcript_18595/g.44696 Transcript_18595/m.44696 type:complete len:95 (+) Transcript_18595:54-338(+)
MATHQFGHSGSGLTSQRVKDLDIAAPRPIPRARALPDDVRAKLKLTRSESEKPRKHNIAVGPRMPKMVKSNSTRSAAGRYESAYSKELNHMERI